MIPVYKPYFTKKTLSYAHDAIDSEWVSSIGYYIKASEEKLKEILGVNYVLLTNNGTSATHLVAKTINNSKSSIVVSNGVYVAAWNSFLYDNLCRKLIFVEQDLKTWNMDMKDLELKLVSNPNVKNILIVHNLGNPINVPVLKQKYKNITFLEDNCEGLFGKYSNQYTGTSSLASSISFYGNKNITSGEGGAFITNSEEEYLKAKQYHGQGQSAKRFIHNDLGNNYRMTNVQAALLFGQLELWPEIKNLKNEIFQYYKQSLRNVDEIEFQEVDNDCEHSNWMFGIRIKNSPGFDIAQDYFNKNGIEIRPMFYPANFHGHIKAKPSKNSNILNKECIILPSYPSLQKHEQELIVSTIKNFIQQYC